MAIYQTPAALKGIQDHENYFLQYRPDRKNYFYKLSYNLNLQL